MNILQSYHTYTLQFILNQKLKTLVLTLVETFIKQDLFVFFFFLQSKDLLSACVRNTRYCMPQVQVEPNACVNQIKKVRIFARISDNRKEDAEGGRNKDMVRANDPDIHTQVTHTLFLPKIDSLIVIFSQQARYLLIARVHATILC